jgi:branched-chain polyamine synthase A-like protein
MPSEVERVRDELAAAWGPEFGRVRRLVAVLLDGDWHAVGELIGATATSRRSVGEILQRLGSWVELDRAGDRARAGDQAVTALAAAFQAGQAPAPGPEEALVASMTAIMGGLPASVRDLDHVPATPATAARRARFLAETFDLGGASVLCLGDHDLTSLALLEVVPGVEVAVVDVDERVLGYVDAVARERGWRVRTVFADLRVELPRSLAGRFDLVFSDPPYTQAGVRLFLRRGLEALRRTEFARLLFCYGFGERQPGLGLKVQAVVQDLRLVAEAILPAFNRYLGAEAIGGASALYVCRPTRRTWPALRDAAARADPRIYTHGEGAEEAALPPLPPATVRALEGLAGDRGELGLTVVGDGLPDRLAGRRVLPLDAYLRDMGAAQGRPPFTASPHDGVVVANLWPHHGAYLPRLLLTGAAARLVVATPKEGLELAGLDPADPLARLLASTWRLRVHTRGGSSAPAVLVAERTGPTAGDPLGFVLRYLVDHRHAVLGNAWREALIAGAAVEARRVSKNQARQAIAAGPLAAQLQSHLAELPLELLRMLVTEVGRTLEQLPATAAGA